MPVLDTHVKDKLYPLVEKALNDKTNVHKLTTLISKYFDKTSYILFAANFSDKLILSYDDKNQIYALIGITEHEIDAIIKQSKTIAKLPWVSNPFTITMALIIRYFIIHKMEKEKELCIIYLTCMFYILTFSKSFPYPPNKEIMDYTLNNNPNVNSSFVIKKEGTIFGTLRYTGLTTTTFYTKSLTLECTDDDLNNYLSGLRTRIGSILKNLANYYYRDHKANNYFNKDTESHDPDNYVITDSTSLAISKLSSKVATNIISYKFNPKYILSAADSDINVYPQRLTLLMDNIIEHSRKDLEYFISLIIELFIVDGGNSIKEIPTAKFLVQSLNLYKTNATKSSVIKIKEFLDRWLDDGSNRHGIQLIRPATIASYKKCIFSVFIYTISRESK